MPFKPVVEGSSPSGGASSIAQLVERSNQPKEEGKDTAKKEREKCPSSSVGRAHGF